MTLASPRLRRGVSMLRRVVALAKDDSGGIGLLGLGLSVCVCMLLVGGVSVASAQMARLDVLDAADHASAAAADRISLASTYTTGVDNTTLDAGAASAEAARIVASTPLPDHVTSWRVSGVEVTGEQVTVRVRAVVPDGEIAHPADAAVADQRRARLDGVGDPVGAVGVVADRDREQLPDDPLDAPGGDVHVDARHARHSPTGVVDQRWPGPASGR